MEVLMKIIKRTICLVLIVLIIVLGIFIKKGYDMYKSALDNESIEDMVSKIKQKENYTTFDELPEDYINAVIAVEAGVELPKGIFYTQRY